MKRRPSSLASLGLAALAALLGASPARAERAPQVRYTFEFITLALAEMPALFAAPPQTADATELRAAVAKLESAGRASLAANAALTTRLGKRAQVKSVIHFPFPTDFDPPNVVRDITGPLASMDHVSTQITSTTFADQDIGLVIEADPSVARRGGSCRTNFDIRLSAFLRLAQRGDGLSTNEHPHFWDVHFRVDFLQHAGKWALLGSFTPPPPVGWKEGNDPPDVRGLCFVRADVVRGPDPQEAGLLNESPGIETMVEAVTLSQADLFPILEKSQSQENAAPFRAELDQLMRAGKARLREVLLLRSTEKRAQTESVLIFPYPTDMDPPQHPQNFTGPIDPKFNLVTPISPTTWTKRNLGWTMEVTPYRFKNRVSTTLSLEWVRLAEDRLIGSLHSIVNQPLCRTLKTNNECCPKSDQLIHFATHAVPDINGRIDPDGERVVILLRETAFR